MMATRPKPRLLALPWRSIATDCGAVAGIGGISYGAWLVYEPAAFLVGGLFVLVLSVLASPERKA